MATALLDLMLLEDEVMLEGRALFHLAVWCVPRNTWGCVEVAAQS